MNIPDEIVEWVNSIFAGCNLRLSEKLSNNPNTQETSLDITFIEHLSRHASPIAFGKNWTVRIDTHFIGGRRHFFGWEIADIGVLVFFKKGGRIIRKKVALLQSKRLYPLRGIIQEESPQDIATGISVLLRNLEEGTALSKIHLYEFDQKSKYKALKVKDQQWKAIKEWSDETNIPVYYMFYNPWTLPFSQQVPLVEYKIPKGECKLGTRVMPSKELFSYFNSHRNYSSPEIGELNNVHSQPHTSKMNAYGWRLESFFSDLLRCGQGYVFDSASDPDIDRLFYRKDAMFAAAIAISVELSE